MNSSATGGYVLPDGETVPNDEELEDILQGFIKGVTGLQGQFIRSRFQVVPLPIPDISVNWCAFGVNRQTQDDGPYIELKNNEQSTSIRHEDIELLLSFYGPQGQSYAKRFIDNSAIPQNVAQIKNHNLKFIEVGDIVTAPDFINEQYVHRFDLQVKFRRKTERIYPLGAFESFQINIENN